MTEEQANKPKDTSNRDMAIRSSAMDMAIRALCGDCYDTEGRSYHDPDRLVNAASKIEQYIKNGLTKLLVIENSDIQVEEPATYFKNKEPTNDRW